MFVEYYLLCKQYTSIFFSIVNTRKKVIIMMYKKLKIVIIIAQSEKKKIKEVKRKKSFEKGKYNTRTTYSEKKNMSAEAPAATSHNITPLVFAL